jgi:hypothetical protein
MISVSPRVLGAALVAAPNSSHFIIRCYQTAEDAHAFHADEPTLLAEIEEWLEDNLPGGRALASFEDFHANLHVVIPEFADAVTFKLAWGEVIFA